MIEEREAEDMLEEYAWDDVNDIKLPIDQVKNARAEEMKHMKGKIFKVVKKSEAWERTGKPPVSSKLAAKSPKAAARRKSFCARMGGMEGPMKDENGKPTRKALALRKWDC